MLIYSPVSHDRLSQYAASIEQGERGGEVRTADPEPVTAAGLWRAASAWARRFARFRNEGRA